MVRGVPGRDGERLDHAVTSPDRIVLAVCGAPGYYSVAMPTWGAPVDLCLPVTRRVREAKACEVLPIPSDRPQPGFSPPSRRRR
jgi:hypothetical protein